MRAPLEALPEAVEEALAARLWYSEQSPAAAAAFDVELEHAVQRVMDAPLRWPRFRHGTRRILLRRFPYHVIYSATDERILIVAVAHSRRRPGYWRKRPRS